MEVYEEAYNFDTYQACNYEANDERLIYYDWLADMATTSHIASHRDLFKTYTSIQDSSITGVGGKRATAIGRGTVELISNCNGKYWTLALKDVLHVPGQKNNLISLGRWDAAGGEYQGGNGKLILVSKNGEQVAQGRKLNNFLYQMQIATKKPYISSSDDGSQTFFAGSNAQDWETWHKWFGHVGYSGLQKLLRNNMVTGFEIIENSPQPDCIACTEAKQHTEPFPKSINRHTKRGDLTHMDLWGKYATRSINGNHYYILMIDDTTRYTTVEFLKEKNQAAQLVMNYLTYLTAQELKPKAIQIDRGKEFVNERLERWCKQNGIQLRLTAPYSPSQNGIAERMNRTLTELARTMLRGQNLPQFLWEPAVLHAAYIRNRSYTKPMGNQTPYEGWFDKKPNVTHLREFGAPVWILSQGQHQDRKLMPKSTRKVYVGLDDGSNSVKYYNPDTRKILTSRNFKAITPSNPQAPEHIVLPPDIRHEGESAPGAGCMPQSGVPKGANRVQRPSEPVEAVEGGENRPYRTRGNRPDYQLLNDPFESEEETEETSIGINETFAIIEGDELTSLRDAERSPDWP